MEGRIPASVHLGSPAQTVIQVNIRKYGTHILEDKVIQYSLHAKCTIGKIVGGDSMNI